MKIFLTGGGGMVGRNVCALAHSLEHVVDAPSHDELDLLDLDALRTHLNEHRPDVVIHAAGLVGGIQANIAAPFDFCYDNLQMGLNVVKASHEVGVKRLINLGSSCMYPRFAQNPLKESDILSGELEPTNEGYGIAKIAVARLVQYLSTQHGMSYKTLIPCNLYGLWDKFGVENSHMIPAVIRKVHEAKINGAPFVDIWGDGTARREFMFAADLADFICFVLGAVDNSYLEGRRPATCSRDPEISLNAQAYCTELDRNGSREQVAGRRNLNRQQILERFDHLPNMINVGVGEDYSVNEYYAVVKDVLGYLGDFKYDCSKPAGMRQKLVDISLQTNLGWKPKTDLKTGIAQTYQFFLNKDQ